MRPEEVRVLYRDEQGHTQAIRASDIEGISRFVEAGASMGHLWLEGRFGLGAPLAMTTATYGMSGSSKWPGMRAW